ncbi:hypothetical protein MJD09_13790, partial [bacterium]|nr:hypothetical protein [bacterium]
LLGLIYLTGAFYLWLARKYLSLNILLALAFPVGIAVFAVCLTILILLPVKPDTFWLAILMVTTYSIALQRLWAHADLRFPRSRELIQIALGLGLYMVAGTSLVALNEYVTISTDGFLTIGLGEYLAFGGTPPVYMFHARQLMSPAIHAIGHLFGSDVFSIYPVLGISFVWLFGTLLYDTLSCYTDRFLMKMILTVSGCLVLSSIEAYHILAFSVGDNLLATVFLTLAFIGLFRYRRGDKQPWLSLAALSLAVFVLTRMESIFVALVPIVMFVWRNEHQTRRDVRLFFGLLSIVILPWFLYGILVIARHWGYEIVHFIDKGPQVLAVLLGTTAYFGLLLFLFRAASKDNWHHLRGSLPFLMTSVFGSLCLAGAYVFPVHAATSIHAVVTNALAAGGWGATLPLLVTLFLVASVYFTSSEKSFFVPAVCSYLLLSFLFVYGRAPFRIGFGDSGNRMFMHIVPIIIFFAVLQLRNLDVSATLRKGVQAAH